jgi:hypothetical protein
MGSNTSATLEYHLNMIGVIPLCKSKDTKPLLKTYEYKPVVLDENGDPPW